MKTAAVAIYELMRTEKYIKHARNNLHAYKNGM